MPKALPKISLVTPCLNAEKTIARTIKSVLSQSYPNLEYIIRDGASSDHTVEVAKRSIASNAVISSAKDSGISAALNRGFDAATGDVFCFLNADDVFMPGTLQYVGQFFEDNPGVDVLTGACLRVFADGSQYIYKPTMLDLNMMAYRNPIDQPSTFWRAKTHRSAGTFDERYKLALDWEWWNRLRQLGAVFATTDRTLSTYYFSDTNLTSNGGIEVITEMARITARYAPRGKQVERAYWLLFWLFDMRGFYDVPFSSLPVTKKIVFRFTLKLLTMLFGNDVIRAYNWNWASKQIRDKVWYK